MDPQEQNDFLKRIGDLIDKKLEHFAMNHPASPQMLYTRVQAANLLGISLSSLKRLIHYGDIRVRRWGSTVLVPHEELLRVAKKDFSTLSWERSPNGKI